MNELGITVPERVSVIGFDNILMVQRRDSGLDDDSHAVKRDRHRGGQSLVQGEIKEPDLPKRKIVIDVELVPRASVATV